MKSASHNREQYVGMWLPEPVVAQPAQGLADDLSLALLLALERLSPLERAAFLLHDVFDMDYTAVGEVIERNETTCRQLAARAREHVREERPRYSPNVSETQKLAEAFVVAAMSGNVEGLARLLANDAVYYSDGGGKRRAALNPIIGKARILRFYEGIRTKGAFTAARAEPAMLNGLAGFVFRTNEGTETVAFDAAHGQIIGIYAVRNPDKLRHLS
jgi:RNA polymerase sigma-70 factor (ECF subfamily)